LRRGPATPQANHQDNAQGPAEPKDFVEEQGGVY
jgi:hypothetical protein